MAKKRKSLTMSLDEVDRTMYSSFCSAANSLSQLYTQSMNQQKLSFQAGEREGLEKLYQWILRLQEGGSRVTTVDILNYLQSELNNYGEEQSMSPRPPFQNPHSQPMHAANSGFPVSLGSTGVPSVGQGIRPDQRSLQNYHIAQGDYYANEGPPANGIKHDEPNFQLHNRDSNGYNSNDASMDMHAESPAHEAPY
nr:uncharacterized protein LOC109170126 [Ipomoea batatas]